MNNDTYAEKIAPSPALKQVVSYYRVREIQLPVHAAIEKRTMHNTGSSIDFFLGDPFQTINLADGKTTGFTPAMIRGVRTYSKYKIIIGGRFRSFSIKFHHGGLYRLLGIPMHRFTDTDLPLDLLNMLPAHEISERLYEAATPQSQKKIIEQYLLALLSKEPVSRISLVLAPQAGNIGVTTDVKEIAATINLSVRQTERVFLQELGLNYKSYAGLQRFNNMIHSRLQQPQSTWTSLAYSAGYYDQMHLVRDFKKHLDITPKQFVPERFAI